MTDEPLIVYVVRPWDTNEDVAVFAREEDAEAFNATYDPRADIERVLVCDGELAQRMIAEREAPDDE